MSQLSFDNSLFDTLDQKHNPKKLTLEQGDNLLTYISLFSSAGVGCFGFKKAGFECIATNELLPKRLKIQAYNNKCSYHSGYIQGDISKKEIKNKLLREVDFWKEKHKITEPDVIISTPPCQGMSVANHKKKDEKNRNSLVIESIKITRELLPKIFIFENVRAFLTTVCTDIDGVDKPIEEAIKLNLGGHYHILCDVLNFKDYGSHSSRTRSLVIGIRKDIENVTPYDIFPKKRNPKTLRQLISHLPALKKMGEVSKDAFHSYREFDKSMLPWIEKLKEGQSAFENKEKKRIPQRVVNGKIIYNTSKNGDKYARWYWDREGPCVHTRNDILSSQNTIHPEDNRVFSIRELMLMMSIPNDFEWSNIKLKDLNRLTTIEKKAFLKKEELNIRHCIGEAIPTGVMSSMALNIKHSLNKESLKLREIKSLTEKFRLDETKEICKFLKKDKKHSLDNLFLIAEHSNSQRQDTAGYFTRQDIVYSIIKEVPLFKNKKKIKILEPSVGVGNFIPLLFKKYAEKDLVEIDVCDIDKNSLEILKTFLSKISVPKNFKIKFIHKDFLEDELLSWQAFDHYDLVIGNPPYKKIQNDKEKLKRYKANVFNKDTNNLFSFFIEKSIQISDYVALIVPKSLLNAPEFNKTRELMQKNNILKICDYGEKGFKGVKIETISFLLETGKNRTKDVIIESQINNSYALRKKNYVLSKDFPYWLIYRSKHFDQIASKMKLGVFQSFRDRQITRSILKDKGTFKVLRARNIGNNKVSGEACYINNPENYVVSKYLNKGNVVMIPNLTYYPRATFLPKDTIVDGSVALLTLKNGHRKPTKKDLDFYSTKDFEIYYKTARNYGTRSLNIDNNSVHFFGILNEKR